LISRGKHARELRIIAGMWRGRRLHFPDVEDIRPTPDRVRETLFNWLGSRVRDARCLDLFAGSGALGLEALSRGAAHAVFVEHNAIAARALEAILAEWQAPSARVVRADALAFLAGPAEPFDIVFVDPPFAAALQASAAARLQERNWLAPGALIYVESAAREPLPALPSGWQGVKAKRAGEVGYHLFERTGSGAAPA
jgi:16S rRNA (guanine966-N2)-methyltransferase